MIIEEIYDEEEEEKDKKSGQIAAKKRKQVELLTNGSKEAEADDKSADDGKEEDDDDEEEESEDEDGFKTQPTKKKKGSQAAPEPVAKAKTPAQKEYVLASVSVRVCKYYRLRNPCIVVLNILPCRPKEALSSKKAKKNSQKADATKSEDNVTAKKAIVGEVKAKGGEKTPAKSPAAKEEQGKPTAAKKPQVRKHPNGLEIHEVAMGKPDGKQAKIGKRVSYRHTEVNFDSQWYLPLLTCVCLSRLGVDDLHRKVKERQNLRFKCRQEAISFQAR